MTCSTSPPPYPALVGGAANRDRHYKRAHPHPQHPVMSMSPIDNRFNSSLRTTVFVASFHGIRSAPQVRNECPARAMMCPSQARIGQPVLSWLWVYPEQENRSVVRIDSLTNFGLDAVKPDLRP
jgi:hypothetical protein